MESACSGNSDVDFQQLLLQTSRTFALAIPLLPEPTRNDVTLAYLILRIADTFEDADNLDPQQRKAALVEFAEILAHRDLEAARQFSDRWSRYRPSENDWYARLIDHTVEVIQAAADLGSTCTPIFQHCQKATLGMADVIGQSCHDGRLELQSLEQLRCYCYFVAGIVGELLTDLFHVRLGELPTLATLRQNARWFGEGLQLVNILKDRAVDAEHERVFLPRSVNLGEVFQLARDDLSKAEEYVAALREAQVPNGYLAFTMLPVQLAYRTLDVVEKSGPGAKITREEVANVLNDVMSQLPGDT